MARLPQPGGDKGDWGNILNDFLSQAHTPSGLLKDNSVTSTVLAPSSVTSTAISSDSVQLSSLSTSLKNQLASYAIRTQPASSISTSKTLPSDYDLRFNLFNYKPAQLAKTRARMAAARVDSGLCKIAFVGDSITNGNGVLKLSESYPARVRAALTEENYPSGGTGYTVGAFDSRWVFGAGWSLQTAVKFTYQCTTNGSTATFTSDVAGTTATVYYRNTGAFTVAIDGGSAVAVAASSTGALRAYTVTGLPNTTHTLVITTQSAFTYICGAEVTRTTGLSISNMGCSGTKVSDWITGVYDSPLGVLQQWVPDLAIIKLGTNDERGGTTTAAQYTANITTLVSTIKGAGIDVVLVAPIPNDQGNTKIAPYLDGLYDVAISQDVPLIDLHDRWGSFASADSLGLMAEGTHPNKSGYFEIAHAVLGALFK